MDLEDTIKNTRSISLVMVAEDGGRWTGWWEKERERGGREGDFNDETVLIRLLSSVLPSTVTFLNGVKFKMEC